MDCASSLLILPANASGEICVSNEGLSFWGGVDPESGTVIDAHHPLHGVCLAGKVVLMPTSRGSCSGSGVLLELALNGKAPAALVFREEEEVLTLGALIAAEMFDCPLAVVRLNAADHGALALHDHAALRGTTLTADGLRIDLRTVTQADLTLSAADQRMLDGEAGKATALAMKVLCTMAAAQGAQRLIDVTRGHIDGCIYAHPANLRFARTMADMGAQVCIPTTINAISVDRENWIAQGLPPRLGQPASALADAYVEMGARPTFTCAPYLAEDRPALGEDIGWSESNAVIFANSVLGARTAKHPDYFDLFVAMTGRAPETGVYLLHNRHPEMIIDVDAPAQADDAFWPLLGWIAGRHAPDCIPVIRGVAHLNPNADDLRALCAAFGTTSAAPMLHVQGVTPEADLPTANSAPHFRVTAAALAAGWDALNTGPNKIDLVALGSPHLSLAEVRRFAALMAGETCHNGTSVILTLGRDIRAQAQHEGLVDILQKAGATLLSDLCWCSITEPLFPPQTRSLMTNSGKYAHYAPGLSGRSVRFGSLEACAIAAQTGRAPTKQPDWLTQDTADTL
ncbi:aconitase X [Sulfitobacter aestuariivivens]|uniref:DUF521 domain-containing protein n=1 Tax=Sulfitobacter aestuariivivens TaxID=2766981 RepID=A0A927D6J4_9RHOB|nr:aconitase X [Sulfitobacter aestuariivivens]MBD3665930.1 DUF521 domain-containing protein [Sulfitobacter aestuariivivens]